ncbi:MAG: hypothetical protein ACUVTR_01975 [Dehalococcoidia bacterium]
MPTSTETLNTLPCPVCKFPILVRQHIREGQQIRCPSCGTISEAIAQGVTIPTSVFVGFICFGLGVLLGPALVATTAAGQRWMERMIKEHIK